MWSLQNLKGTDPGIIHAGLKVHGRAMSFADVTEAWRSDSKFRAAWVALLREIPFEAYCWENPPLTTEALGNAHECVFVESPALAGSAADVEPFSEQVHGRSGSVAFQNLGGDALLVVPCPMDKNTNYAHLAVFTRTASAGQAEEFWRLLGQTLAGHLANTPVWMSTAGLGVSWLHARLDSRPKYYRYRPYASSGFWGGRK